MNEIIKSNGIKFGLILGAAGVLMHLIIYLLGGVTDENKMLGSSIQIGFWLGYLIIRIIQCTNTKKELNGIVSFKELFTTLTICITIGILIAQFFTFFLNNYIDAEYGKAMNEFMNEQQVLALKAMKSITDVSKEDLTEAANMNNFSILNTLKASAISFLISSIMNLILAAIFKSKTNTINE